MDPVGARFGLLIAAAVVARPGIAAAGPPLPDAPAAPAQSAAADTVRPAPALFPVSPHAGLRFDAGLPAAGPRPPRLELTYSSIAQSYLRDVQLNRFDAALLGADRGAYAGIVLGFLGTQTGVLSERKALALMGAGALLGALWGGSRPVEDRHFRVLVQPTQWGPAEMLRYDPRDRDP